MNSPGKPSSPAFHATRWSLILRTRGQGDDAQHALETLCQAYWFPLYAWCRSHQFSPQDSEDLVQGFFAKVIETQLFAAADSSRGKLRTFLLTAFQRYVKDQQEKSLATRRGSGRILQIDPAEAEAHFSHSHLYGESPDHLYDRHWALAVLSETLRQLELQATSRGKSAEFHAMRPFLTEEGSLEAYTSAALPLGMSPGSFKTAVHRLRQKFRDALHHEITQTQSDDSDPHEEIAYLARILAQG